MWGLAPIAALAAALAGHAVLCRMVSQSIGVAKFLAVGFPVGGLLAWWLVQRYGLTPETIGGLAAYAFASELYIFLFNSAATSVSANLLVHLRHGTLSLADIAERYDSDRMVARRVDWMVEGGLLSASPDGTVVPTEKGLRLVMWQGRLRRFFRHERPYTSPH
ncbi:MAG: hypothetical protein ACHQF3_08270 [Alphaproteobacteria bacterium]